MKYLFLSRKNVHFRYYLELTKGLDLPTQVYRFGFPVFRSFSYLGRTADIDLSEVIETQLKRRKAKQPGIRSFSLLLNLYIFGLRIFEKFRVAKYLYLFEKERPISVVLWNGKKLPNQIVAIVAAYLEIPVFYFEIGLLPNTTTLDAKGVNYAASIPRDKIFYEKMSSIESNRVKTEIAARKPLKNRSKFSTIDLPERYIFVPFQVPHDTQIACYSPWIDSMEMMYEMIMNAVDKSSDKETIFVFKEHPSWKKHFEHLYNKHPRAMFANGNQTVDLIKNAEAIITINSTVGLEALSLSKKVITLGEACYNVPSLVQNATNLEDLISCLNNVKSWDFDKSLRDNFFKYLREIYCIPSSHHKITLEHTDAIKARLLGEDLLAELVVE